MRIRITTAFALPLTLFALGCEKTPKDKLQGRWLGEPIENAPASQLAKATGWVKGAAIEFAGNKVTVQFCSNINYCSYGNTGIDQIQHGTVCAIVVCENYCPRTRSRHNGRLGRL